MGPPLLGANGYAPFLSDPAHRPFDLPAVLRAMARVDRKSSSDLVGPKTFLKLDKSTWWKSAVWGGWKATLTHEAPAGDVLALQPSIGLVELHNAPDTLTISGLFGDPSNLDRSVNIGATCTVDFRAATGAFRTAPETAVNQSAINADPTLQTGVCQYAAQGRYADALGSIDLAVVGSPTMPWLDLAQRLAPTLPARRAWVQAQFHASDRSMDVQMFHYIAPSEGGGPQQTLTALDGKVTVVPVTGMDETAASGNNPVRIDLQGNLQPGSNQQTGNYLTWSGALAAHQEDSRAGR